MRANAFTVLRNINAAARSRSLFSGGQDVWALSSPMSCRRALLSFSPLRHHCLHLQSYSNHLRHTPRSSRHCRYVSSVEATSFADPTRPDLFYHLLHPPTPFSSSLPMFALSFLPAPPPIPDSCTIIGWLPAATEGADGEAGLNDFKENRASFFVCRPISGRAFCDRGRGEVDAGFVYVAGKFMEVLHAAIRAGIVEGVDEVQVNGAVQTQNGWMHIHGTRVFAFVPPPPRGNSMHTLCTLNR